ncbi:unnamed protein product, partial [Iphiclides podalirius]
MRSLVALLCMVVAVSAVSFVDVVKEEWDAFKMEYQKEYGSEVEDQFRMKIYAENKHKIAKHNQRFAQGLVSYRLKVNKYADMLHNEFVNAMNGFNSTAKQTINGSEIRGATFLPAANVQYPDHIDWRELGAVTEVKDQRMCGSCWSFSSTGALEGQHFRKSKKLVSLSEQNLVDCSTAYGNNGCNGGTMDSSFKYVQENKGIDTEDSYPYEGVEKQCRYNPKNSGADDVGFTDIPTGDEEKLMQAVATIGPIAVAIDASQPAFHHYSEGVYYDENCSSTRLDHAVLAVGYGTDEKGGDYWLVKNSWGLSWGEKGYIKMARNRKNNCGIATEASYPIV